MRTRTLAALVLPATLLAAAPLAAQTTSLLGDKDCFGLGGSCPDGTRWSTDLGGSYFSSYRDASDPLFTDQWFAETNLAYGHSYLLPGSVTGAVLEIRTAGLADFRGPWNVFFNGLLAGSVPTNTGPSAEQAVVTHQFVIDPTWLSGDDQVLLAVSGGDGYSIDYSQLTMEVGRVSAVPEPASVLLLGSGIAGLGVVAARRRKRQS